MSRALRHGSLGSAIRMGRSAQGAGEERCLEPDHAREKIARDFGRKDLDPAQIGRELVQTREGC